MRNIVFHAQGWEDFTYWATADKKMFRRLLRLIEEARRTHSKVPASRSHCALISPASGPGGLTTSTVSSMARQMMS